VTTQWSFAAHILPLLNTCNGCHTSNFTYANLVNVAATTASGCNGTGWVRVKPSDPTNSLIYRKLLASVPCGSRMPLGTTTGWPAADIEKVRAWIADGAPNN
jgi:hypothetical protein